MLLHLKTGLELLLVLLGVIVHPLALGALQLDEVVLGHMGFRLMGAVCVKRFLPSRPSLRVIVAGATSGGRTQDRQFTKLVLYRLS
jgi:hypothetical protein